MENGTPPEQGIMDAAKAAARKCLDVLKARTNTPITPTPDPELPNPELPLLNGDGAFEYDFVMQDGSPDYGYGMGMGIGGEVGNEWMFSGWDMNTEW